MLKQAKKIQQQEIGCTQQDDTMAAVRPIERRKAHAGHEHAGSKAPTQIDEVEMDRSARQQRHARSSCLHGSAGSRRVAGLGRHHGGTGRGEIHLPPCDEDQVLMVPASGEPGDEAAAATWR